MLWGVRRHWSSHASAVTARASMRGSSSAGEPARRNAIIPSVAARVTDPFPRRIPKPGAKRKFHVVFADTGSLETNGARLLLYTVLRNSA